jgi:hypothetical protein
VSPESISVCDPQTSSPELGRLPKPVRPTPTDEERTVDENLNLKEEPLPRPFLALVLWPLPLLRLLFFFFFF